MKRVHWENFGGWNHLTSRDTMKTIHLRKKERLLRVLICQACGMW